MKHTICIRITYYFIYLLLFIVTLTMQGNVVILPPPLQSSHSIHPLNNQNNNHNNNNNVDQNNIIIKTTTGRGPHGILDAIQKFLMPDLLLVHPMDIFMKGNHHTSFNGPFGMDRPRCLKQCACKLNLIKGTSETTCRSLSYEVLIDSIKNATQLQVQRKNILQTTKGHQGLNSNLLINMTNNDLWKRNRGRENRLKLTDDMIGEGLWDDGGDTTHHNNETSSLGNTEKTLLSEMTEINSLLGSVDEGAIKNLGLLNGHNYALSDFYYNISTLTLSFNNIPFLRRDLFTQLKQLDNGNGLNQLTEVQFYFNKIKMIATDLFDDFLPNNNSPPKDGKKFLNITMSGLKHLKIIEHQWHLDSDDYFNAFPYECLKPFANSLLELYLTSPNIKVFSIASLSYLEMLHTLVIKSSLLSDVETNPVTTLPPSLKNLVLSGDGLNHIPTLGVSMSIKKLELTSQGLDTIKETDFQSNFLGVEELSLSNCNISVIHEGAFFPLSQTLKHLDLHNNKIRDINFLNNLQSLQHVDLSGNSITSLPDNSFSNLPALEHLSLKFNRIHFLGHILRESSRLQTLLLKSNSLHEMPRILHRLNNLETLDLSRNYISKVSKNTFKNNKKLSKLDLSSNYISRLEPGSFKGLESSLTDFKIFHNQLTNMESNVLRYMKNLTFLDLSYNNLTNLQIELFENCQDSLLFMDIAFNPWHCDCKLKTFRIWMEARISNLFFLHRFKARTILGRAKCATPLHMSGVPLSYPPLNAFVCHESSDNEVNSNVVAAIKGSNSPSFIFDSLNNSTVNREILGISHESEEASLRRNFLHGAKVNNNALPPRDSIDDVTGDDSDYEDDNGINSAENSLDRQTTPDYDEVAEVNSEGSSLINTLKSSILELQRVDTFTLEQIKVLYWLLINHTNLNIKHLNTSLKVIDKFQLPYKTAALNFNKNWSSTNNTMTSNLSLALSMSTLILLVCFIFYVTQCKQRSSTAKFAWLGNGIKNKLYYSHGNSNGGNTMHHQNPNAFYPPHQTLSRLSSSLSTKTDSTLNNNTTNNHFGVGMEDKIANGYYTNGNSPSIDLNNNEIYADNNNDNRPNDVSNKRSAGKLQRMMYKDCGEKNQPAILSPTSEEGMIESPSSTNLEFMGGQTFASSTCSLTSHLSTHHNKPKPFLQKLKATKLSQLITS